MRVSWSQTLVKKRCTFQEDNLGALGPIKMEYIFVTPSFQMFLFDFFVFFTMHCFWSQTLVKKRCIFKEQNCGAWGQLKWHIVLWHQAARSFCRIFSLDFFRCVFLGHKFVKKGCTFQEHNLGALGPIKMEYIFVSVAKSLQPQVSKAQLHFSICARRTFPPFCYGPSGQSVQLPPHAYGMKPLLAKEASKGHRSQTATACDQPDSCGV